MEWHRELRGTREVELISAQELNEKLDRRADDFKLVMVLGEWEYQAKHIPGSLRISTVEEALQALRLHEEITTLDVPSVSRAWNRGSGRFVVLTSGDCQGKSAIC